MSIIATAPVPAGNLVTKFQTIELPKMLTAPAAVPFSSDDPDNPRTPEWSEGYLQGVNEARKLLGERPRRTPSRSAWMAGYQRGAEEGPDRPSPAWPPKTCPSWCPHADNPAEHLSDLGADHYEDRSCIHDHYACTGESASDCEPGEIPLTLEKLWAYETGPIGKRVTRLTYQTLVAQLSQHYREAEPRIGLGHHTGDLPERGSGVDLTLDEAQALIDLLTHLVELGRQG